MSEIIVFASELKCGDVVSDYRSRTVDRVDWHSPDEVKVFWDDASYDIIRRYNKIIVNRTGDRR